MGAVRRIINNEDNQSTLTTIGRLHGRGFVSVRRVIAALIHRVHNIDHLRLEIAVDRFKIVGRYRARISPRRRCARDASRSYNNGGDGNEFEDEFEDEFVAVADDDDDSFVLIGHGSGTDQVRLSGTGVVELLLADKLKPPGRGGNGDGFTPRSQIGG